MGAGIGGMLLAMLLHLIQHWAYGYSLDAVISPQSFLSGVTDAPPWRKVAAMAVCGLVAGFGWWMVYALGRPLVSIKQAVKSDEAAMPAATIGHALLQIITVALGSPLGREVAPREIGALLASWLSRCAGLSPADTRIMVACGAGAGLAAVYNVPLGGAVFTLEVLLQTFTPTAAVPAILTSVIAALVAWVALGDESQYRLPHLEISAALVGWSLVTGPLFGIAGHWYTRLATTARNRAPRDGRLVPWCLGVFVAIGTVSIWYPELLGNGKGPGPAGRQAGALVPGRIRRNRDSVHLVPGAARQRERADAARSERRHRAEAGRNPAGAEAGRHDRQPARRCRRRHADTRHDHWRPDGDRDRPRLE